MQKKTTLPPTAYDILGIAKNASQNDIHTALRRHALSFHPDRVPAHQRDAATRNFHVIMDAYNKIRDPRGRLAYDATLRTPQKTNDNSPVLKSWLNTLETVFWPFNKR